MKLTSACRILWTLPGAYADRFLPHISCCHCSPDQRWSLARPQPCLTPGGVGIGLHCKDWSSLQCFSLFTLSHGHCLLGSLFADWTVCLLITTWQQFMGDVWRDDHHRRGVLPVFGDPLPHCEYCLRYRPPFLHSTNTTFMKGASTQRNSSQSNSLSTLIKISHPCHLGMFGDKNI